MLSIKGLDVYHGYVRAVANLSLEVRRGELLAVLGANGAGKATPGWQVLQACRRGNCFNGKMLQVISPRK